MKPRMSKKWKITLSNRLFFGDLYRNIGYRYSHQTWHIAVDIIRGTTKIDGYTLATVAMVTKQMHLLIEKYTLHKLLPNVSSVWKNQDHNSFTFLKDQLICLFHQNIFYSSAKLRKSALKIAQFERNAKFSGISLLFLIFYRYLIAKTILELNSLMFISSN